MRALRTLAVVGLIAIASLSPTCAAERVDLLLVLAADISHSVDEVKFQLQRSGYAAAFSDSRVIEAIRSGPNGRIAVELVEWSGPLSQKIVIDWMVISDDKTARLFGDHIVEATRAFADSTSISAGIDFAMTQLDGAPYETRRRVIDVSEDGDNNSGRDVTAARDEAMAKGITINGLVILTEPPTPWKFQPHQPSGWACKLLPQQRHRRLWRVRHGRGKLQLIRGHHRQKADRGNRASCATTAGGELTTQNKRPPRNTGRSNDEPLNVTP